MRQLIVLAAVVATVVTALLALAGGVTVSSGLAGHGWRLPPASLSWVGRAISGKPLGRWFSGYPAPVPRPGHGWVVWTVAGILFAIVVQVLVVAALWLRAALGTPGQGMATSRDVDDALGLDALRKAGRQVRPDLHAQRRSGPYSEQPAPEPLNPATRPDPAPQQWTPPGSWSGLGQ